MEVAAKVRSRSGHKKANFEIDNPEQQIFPIWTSFLSKSRSIIFFVENSRNCTWKIGVVNYHDFEENFSGAHLPTWFPNLVVPNLAISFHIHDATV